MGKLFRYPKDEFAVERSRALTPLFFDAPCPAARTPMAYQSAGVEYALARNHVIFGDAPGVGKSAQSIFLDNVLDSKRTLVVCPASLRLNWEREIWLWTTRENTTTSVIKKGTDGVSPLHDFVVLSYDLLRNKNIFEAIMDLRWDHVILDEAHYLKDPKGNRRTQVICAPDALPSVAGRFSLLTGTLLPNQPIEAYNAIKLLDWDTINRASLDDFRNFYYAESGGMVRGPVQKTDDKGNIYTVSELHWSNTVRNQPQNLDDFQYRLRSRLMVRRTKDEVLPQIPPKQWHIVPLATTPEMRRALKHPGWGIVEKMYEMDAHAFDHDIPVDGAISTARLELGLAKAPAVIDYIRQLLDEGTHKIVVSAWHIEVLAMMREGLDEYGLAYMDGRTSQSRKQAAVDRFQQDPAVRVILGQMIPLGEGWTLTAAQDAVLAEPFWVPGKNDQLVDRIHRLGQTGRQVLAHVPVVPDTLDEKILGRAIEKDQHIYLAMDHRHV